MELKDWSVRIAGVVVLAILTVGCSIDVRTSTSTESRPLPPQIKSWLEKDGRIAHRGGSADFPEMSRYAYDRALEAGYQALEITLARSADGTWFGLHDSDLDRTSGVGDVAVEDSTWAEIDEHRILAAASDAGTPGHQRYLTLGEFLDAYYGKAILFLDPKRAGDHVDELLDILDALPGDATRTVVAKQAWRAGASPWLPKARERGYTTWRAFGQDDDFLHHHEDADLLGMSYRASPQVWKKIRSLGKPVIAHVVPDARAANVALGKGADGLMVSGVTEVRRAVTAQAAR
ncbi:glycerophosphoryl diester phosphodiesterase [Marmoricola sp. OAE513]|uniref:glycerophosphodiester phosphodiesterase n=1 Tax=Marmoricola sp. OAE513 TaxID=2817894 RepID=UPI001AE97E93